MRVRLDVRGRESPAGYGCGQFDREKERRKNVSAADDGRETDGAKPNPFRNAKSRTNESGREEEEFGGGRDEVKSGGEAEKRWGMEV